jgi:uncharacterized coiled-coil protein SlyX
MQGSMSRLGEGQDDIKARLTTLEVTAATVLTVIGNISGDMARQQVTLDRFDKRLDRIERRLDLVDTP